MNFLMKIGCLFFAGFFLSGCTSEKAVLWEEYQTESVTVIESDSDTECRQSEDEYQICVDVSGAVHAPGVYLLDNGARVYQAVEMAGGLREDADRDSINQAAFLKDGEKVRIYTVEESVELQKSQEESGMVNLNTASLQQLCTLAGIGESRAKDIIAYREEYGSFENVEEIMNVSGIKETTFQKIRDKIVVE